VVRVLVADDDARVCSALELVLEQVPGFVVLGALRSAGGLARHVRQTRPDVLLLDWEQPGLDGRALLEELRAYCPGLLVVALGSGPQVRAGAVAAGADYFVAKCDPPAALLACLRTLVSAATPLASAA
jgi:DNA-binding NarL/FixJ family response regulator